MKRYEKNPIITREMIPTIPPHLKDVSSVYNPGAIKFGDQYLLLLRVQNRGRETFFVKAISRDGVNFEVADQAIHLQGLEKVGDRVYHAYDPRITRIDDTFHIMFAMDMDGGCALGLAQTRDFDTYEFMGIVSEGDIRNGVLFPEKVGGRYLRLDRPNRMQTEGGPTSGSAIYLSESHDLLTWKPVQEVMAGRFHYWDELIGAGPPPIKIREGWLQIYHGVATHFASSNIYQAGVALLDLEDPGQVIRRSRCNILEPRELYELTGQVPNVVFPSGAIVEELDGEGFADPESRILVYYGAADTSVCLAFTTVKELLQAADE